MTNGSASVPAPLYWCPRMSAHGVVCRSHGFLRSVWSSWSVTVSELAFRSRLLSDMAGCYGGGGRGNPERPIGLW